MPKPAPSAPANTSLRSLMAFLTAATGARITVARKRSRRILKGVEQALPQGYVRAPALPALSDAVPVPAMKRNLGRLADGTYYHKRG